MINIAKRQFKYISKHDKTSQDHTKKIIDISLPITCSKDTFEKYEDWFETVIKPTKTWNFYNGELTDDFKLGHSFEKGIRWLLSWSKKAVNGIDCPINFMAGCCQMDTGSMSRLVRSFVNKGYLELVAENGQIINNGVKRYRKARTYRVIGALLEMAKEITKAFKKKSTEAREELPERLIHHQAHSQLFKIAKAFKGNFEGFQRQMGMTFGIYENGRWDEGISIWEWLNKINTLELVA